MPILNTVVIHGKLLLQQLTYGVARETRVEAGILLGDVPDGEQVRVFGVGGQRPDVGQVRVRLRVGPVHLEVPQEHHPRLQVGHEAALEAGRPAHAHRLVGGVAVAEDGTVGDALCKGKDGMVFINPFQY